MSKLNDFIIKYRVRNLNELLELYTNEHQTELIELIENGDDLDGYENDVISAVCKSHDVTIMELCARSRERHIVDARANAYLLLYAGTKMTLSQIGKTIRNQDHATVLHSLKKMVDLYQFDISTQVFIDDSFLYMAQMGYNCNELKTKLNGKRKTKGRTILTHLKGSISRRPLEIPHVEFKDNTDELSTPDSGTSGGVFFGENSVCVF
jgi:hypothetical protein